MILGISGKIGTGKTTLAQLTAERLTAQGLGVVLVSFGRLLKEEASLRFNFEYGLCCFPEGKESIIYHPDLPSQSMSVRQILQWWGTDVRRAEDKDYWVRYMARTVAHTPADVIIIDDVRFPNEAQWVTHNDGVLIRLAPYAGWRPGEYSCHVSETALDDFNFACTHSPDYGELPTMADLLAVCLGGMTRRQTA